MDRDKDEWRTMDTDIWAHANTGVGSEGAIKTAEHLLSAVAADAAAEALRSAPRLRA